MAKTVAKKPLDLATIIGRNLRRIRETVHAETQAELTDRLRSFGLNWNRSQVAKAERGERAFTIEQVALIATALDIDMTELVRAEPRERVALSPAATCDAEFLVALFDATPPNDRPLQLPHLDCPQTRHWATTATTASLPSPSEAEERLARALGTTPAHVGQAAQALWDRPFVEEREERLSERIAAGMTDTSPPARARRALAPQTDRDHEAVRTIAAVRGHVTRELLAELRLTLESPTRSRRPRAPGGKIDPALKADKISPDLRAPRRGRTK